MSERMFEVPEPGKFARLFPLFVGVVPTLAILAALPFVGQGHPAPARLYVALMLLPATAAVMAWSMRARRLRLRDQVFHYGGLPWRRVRVDALDLDAAASVDLNARAEWQPRFKIAGTRLPGYHAGWFRLRNGRRAFVVLTDWKHVLVLPRRDGGLLLLSVARPDALLAALRDAAR